MTNGLLLFWTLANYNWKKITPENIFDYSKNEKGWVKVIGEDQRVDKETFALLSVHPNEVRDLDFANDACKALTNFIDLIKSGKIIAKESLKWVFSYGSNLFILYTFVKTRWKIFSIIVQLLTECIYFVTNQANHLVDPLKIVDFIPSRDRQKLLREQGVLKQVFFFHLYYFVIFSFFWYLRLICTSVAKCIPGKSNLSNPTTKGARLTKDGERS